MQPQQPQFKPQPHQSPPPQQQPAPGPEQAYPPNPQQANPQNDYSFITEPANPFPKQGALASVSNAPLIGKLLVAVCGVFVLGIVFVIIKAIAGSGGGSFNTAALISVAQDQQEIVHLTTNVNQKKQGLADSTVSSAVTIQIVATDAQAKLLAYLGNNHKKVNPKVLVLKISSATDAQMAAALTNGTMDETYLTVMQAQLNTYARDLKTAYAGDKGTKGRAMLSTDYNSAQLLLQQLNSPSS